MIRLPTEYISRFGALAGLLLSAACVPSGHLAGEQAPAPAFDPIAFFAGHTHGTGILSVLLHKRQPTDVEGRGRIEGDGSITLDQTVKQGDKSSTRRRWRLHSLGSGRYIGTLTDVTGPVTGEVMGNRLHLAFAMRHGLNVDQWLYLHVGGQVARNRMVVTKFGLPVATLDETISRVND